MTKRVLRFISLCTAAVLLSAVNSSCKGGTEYKSYAFYSMDTIIEVKLDPATPDIDRVFDGCRALTEEVRQILDADSSSSAVSLFNASEGGCAVPELLAELCTLSRGVYTASGGAFDITLRPLIRLWKDSEAAGVLPGTTAVSDVLALRGMDGLTYDGTTGVLSKGEGVGIDLGGIGKGAAAEKLLEYLGSSGAGYGVISLGGNIALYGAKPDGEAFSVSLRDPAGRGTVGDLSLTGGFVSVSGDYERYYEIDGKKYHHIFDPDTGYPAASGLHSVAVISGNGAEADALSTALFVMGYGEGMKLYESGGYDFEAVFITDGEIMLTPGLTDRFTLTSGAYTVK